MIRFIHSGDIHLGLQFTNVSFHRDKAIKRRRKLWTTFERMINHCKKEAMEKAILEKYNLNFKLDLKKLYDESYLNQLRIQENNSSYKVIQEKNDVTIKKIADIRKIKEKKTEEFSLLLKEDSSKSLDEFKLALENKNVYNRIVAEMDNMVKLKKRVMGDHIEKLLEEEITSYPKLTLLAGNL